MKKIFILIVLIMVLVLTGTAQRVKTYFEVRNATVAFGTALPKYTIVYDASTNKMYVLTESEAATATLTSATKRDFPNSTIPIDTANYSFETDSTIFVTRHFLSSSCDTTSQKVISPCDDTLTVTGNLYVDKRLNVDSVIMLADTVIIKRFGEKSYSFGFDNRLLTNFSLVAGYHNYTVNNFGYVFGHNNIKITDAIVSGRQNDSITSSFVLGGFNENITNSTICGYHNQEINGSLVAGLNNTSITDSYVTGNTNNTIDVSGAFGNYNNNITASSYAFGENNTVLGNYSYSIGQTNNNITTNSYNIGFANDSISDNSFSIGEQLDTITNYSYVFGIGNQRINNFSFVIGSTNKDITKDCNVLGQFNRYIDTTSTVVGALNTNIKKSYVFGNYCDTIYNKSFAIGTGLYNVRDTLFAFGKYNIDVSDSTDKRAFVFAYGGGNTTRKNYAEILKNGKLYLNYGGIHTQGVSRMRTDTLFIDSTNTTLTAAFTQWVYIKTGADNDTITFPVATKDLAGVEITITKDNSGIGDCVINYESSEAILTAIDDYAIIRCNGYRWILYGNKLTP